MKSLRWVSLLATMMLSLVATVSASRNPIGLDPQLHHQSPPPVIRLQPCNVLYFGVDEFGEVPRLSGLGLLVTQTANPADLSAANLAQYDVLMIAFTGQGMIGAHQADIEAFVAANNGLLIHQPNVATTIDYAPAGFGVTVSNECWCGDCNTTNFNGTIVNGVHPITSGLADADLSGDFDLTSDLGAGYTVLARNTSCDSPSLAAGTFGTGRVAYETGNFSPLAFVPGSDGYLAHLFEWLCVGGTTPTNADTWGRLKVLYR